MNFLDRASRRPLLSTFTAVSLLAAGCATVGAKAKDDDDPEIVRRTGKRAIVMVEENAFAYSSGGNSLTVSGPNGTQTYSWTVLNSGWGWSQDKARQLQTYFESALDDTGAFYVADRATLAEAPTDGNLERGGIQEASDVRSKAKRPDLKLVCTLTKLEDDAGGSSDSARGSWWDRWSGGGSSSRSTRRGECEIMIKIVDRASTLVVATAKGQGFSVGTSQRTSVHGSGWRRAIFASAGGSTSEYENVDMSAAIQRATVRAVNDLVNKIPADYFRHQVTFGGAGTGPAAVPDAEPSTTAGDKE